MEVQAFHPLDYLSVVRRRKWWLIIPLAASVVIGASLAALWPREYISEAQIGVAMGKDLLSRNAGSQGLCTRAGSLEDLVDGGQLRE